MQPSYVGAANYIAGSTVITDGNQHTTSIETPTGASTYDVAARPTLPVFYAISRNGRTMTRVEIGDAGFRASAPIPVDESPESIVVRR